MKRRNKVAAAVATLALVVAGGGAAWAYWTFGGAGTGDTTTKANPTGIVITQNAVSGLAPGESVALSGMLTNPNNTDVKVGTLKAMFTTPPGVAKGDFSLSGPVVIDKVIKTGAPLAWSGITLTYANSDANQDNAKSVKVDLTYTLSAFSELPPPNGVTFENKLFVADWNYSAAMGTGPAWFVMKDTTSNVSSAPFASAASRILHYSGEFPMAITSGHVYQLQGWDAASMLNGPYIYTAPATP